MEKVSEFTSSQLSSALTNLKTWGGVIFNVKDFGAKGGGITDDTIAIQKAINAANAWIDASNKGLREHPLEMKYRGGVVYFPPGIYNVLTINMKSGIVFRGAGVLATRLNPIGTSGYIFDRDSSEQWLSQVVFEDFTIAPTDEHFAFTTRYATPPTVGGFNFTLTSQAYMSRINILNIAGIGIHMAECYDSFFDQIEVIFVGADTTKPGIGMYPGIAVPGGRDPSIIDVTNACHLSRVRIENCYCGLELDGTKYTNKLLRELQFTEFKIENSPSVIKHIFGATFTNCHITSPTDTSMFAWTVGDAAPTDTRGVSFDDCTFFSGSINTRKIFNIIGVSTYDFKIRGGSSINIASLLQVNADGTAGLDVLLPITIDGHTATLCGTPFVKVKQKLRMQRCQFYDMRGTDYVIYAGDMSRILDCDFNKTPKAINMNTNCQSKYNQFGNVSTYAHYVTSPNNVIDENIYDGDVVKAIEYETATHALKTFKSSYLTSRSPGGYNTNHIITEIGTNDAYGVATITLNKWTYFTNPQFKLIGTLETETVTYKIEVYYEDGTTAFIEKTFASGTVDNWLTTEEIAPLIKNQIPIIDIKLYSKSNTTNVSSIASCRVWIIANIH